MVAAWLGGSLGRGTADVWSDPDVWVIVADDEAANVNAARRELVAAVARPVLVEEAPENASPGGAYLLVLYGGATGAHQVDWYWQTRATTRMPSGVRVLFDRVGLPSAPATAPMGAAERAAALTDGVAVFWIAVLLAGKAVVRRRPWAATRTIGWAATALAEVEWILSHDVRADHDDLKDAGQEARWAFPGAAPGIQPAGLRQIAGAMSTLALDVAALGGDVAIDGARQVSAFFDFVGDRLDHDQPDQDTPRG